MSDDVLAVRVEHIGQQGRRERMIMIVMYMTVESERDGRENSMKYEILKKIVREHAGGRVMVMVMVNRNGKMLVVFTDEMNLENLNETLAEGRVTWRARNQDSAIDFMLVNGKMLESVTRIWINEDRMIDILLDHNMLLVDCKIEM